MKVLLATLALLPVIASHVYLQLPPHPDTSSSTGHQMPLSLRQYSHQEPKSPGEAGDPQSSQESSAPEQMADNTYEGVLSSSQQQRLRQNLYDAVSSTGQDFGNFKYLDTETDWQRLFPSSADARYEPLTVGKSSGNYKFSFSIPEGLMAQEKRAGVPAFPLGYLFPPSIQHPLSFRPVLAYSRFPQNLSHRSDDATSTSSKLHLDSSLLDGAKKSPAKRYLGIELPDYIASNYGADKTNNAKIHSLKQRMRSVGK